MTMPATVRSLPSNETQETIDFLRRLASMMSGGRNAEMLQAAASAIDTLSRRAAAAEGQLEELQDDHGKNLEQRDVAELASDNLLAELNALKAHLSQSEAQADTELAALKAELADHQQHAEAEIGDAFGKPANVDIGRVEIGEFDQVEAGLPGVGQRAFKLALCGA